MAFGGSLAGLDVKAPARRGVGANSAVASGSFTLTSSGGNLGPISYSSNVSTLAGNIQAALVAHGAIGSGNVTVTYDSAGSTAHPKCSASITINARSRTNMADLAANRRGTRPMRSRSRRRGSKVGPRRRKAGGANRHRRRCRGRLCSAPCTTARVTRPRAITLNANQVHDRCRVGDRFRRTRWSQRACRQPDRPHVRRRIRRHAGRSERRSAASHADADDHGGFAESVASRPDRRYPAPDAGTGIGSETQRVTLDPNNQTGTYTLTFVRENVRYVTANLPFDATAAAVQTALNDAVSTISGASVAVSSPAATTGVWDVTFGGSLAGEDVALLQVQAVADLPSPSGSFSIEVADEVSAPIEYASDSIRSPPIFAPRSNRSPRSARGT